MNQVLSFFVETLDDGPGDLDGRPKPWSKDSHDHAGALGADGIGPTTRSLGALGRRRVAPDVWWVLVINDAVVEDLSLETTSRCTV
jgi:hypothetical protein